MSNTDSFTRKFNYKCHSLGVSSTVLSFSIFFSCTHLLVFMSGKSHLKWFRTALFYCSSASRGNQRGQFGHPYDRRQRIDLELKDRHAVSNAPSPAWEGTCVCPLNYLEIGQDWWWNWSCFPICKWGQGSEALELEKGKRVSYRVVLTLNRRYKEKEYFTGSRER